MEHGKQDSDAEILPALSQTARAKALLEAGKISFDPKLHLFNVLGSGDKPYVVRFFPTEYCSRPSKGLCYHVIAVKRSIRDMAPPKCLTVNVTSLQRNVKSRNDKQSGRKHPCAKDIIHTKSDENSLSSKKSSLTNDPNYILSLENQASDDHTCKDRINPDENNSDSLVMDSPFLMDDIGFCDKYFNYNDEKALPGAEMYLETPIEVSEKMQRVIVENHNIFDYEPIGPLYKSIPEQIISFLPAAILHCYVLL